MATPDFILALREKVGHDLLWLNGVVAVVVDDQGRVLLNKRADTGSWSLISGILEPGEQPDEALEREVLEETGVTIRASRLLDAFTSPIIEYPNGDRAQYLTVAYRCDVVAGEPRVNDDESLEVRFVPRQEMPKLRDDLQRVVDLAFL
ncbi:NUDIX hydrolase [Algisphaera agarilytica]|uniref:8-oxo-dGTP pyrophosphatase MutT (NUDIX family) n=1 Tax=Algisphaera agarilytica TaxID=1385975 RepID=A0A7X0H7S4_9BACT|nr:NUDIX domain-containing protein [Algisphaera agarilytica]MBB6430826.1 8-oxo-dGTP pyrophosphatase MutT (NUDIX family) [Algisphaera agarilytica]